MPAGRPSDYTPEKCDDICAEIIRWQELKGYLCSG